MRARMYEWACDGAPAGGAMVGPYLGAIRLAPSPRVTDLLQQLQTALGAAYMLERELGGGGMSRVYLAEDAALGRRIVIKVLAPELAEGLSAERFAREIRLAARLQHPNVVPVLAAGAVVVRAYPRRVARPHSQRPELPE